MSHLPPRSPSPSQNAHHHASAAKQNSMNIRSVSVFGHHHGASSGSGGAEGVSDSRPVTPDSFLSMPRGMSPQRVLSDDVEDHAASQEGHEYTYAHDPTASRSPSTAPKSLKSRSSSSCLTSLSHSTLRHGGGSSLPALQARAIIENDGLEPLTEEEVDPASFDLVVPAHAPGKLYSLETQSELLFSSKHLEAIFEDPVLLQRFTNFIYQSRPQSVPLLQYYLDALKALKAIEYSNSVVASLGPVEGLEYTSDSIDRTLNRVLREKADKAFETLTHQELPAYITHTYIQTASVTIKRRIADTLPPHLREMSEGLAEVFCLTDPTRPDNPIIFASEEFHRTTQYGMSYVLGRNCRFLQGPKTNPFSVRRIREKLDAGLEHCETFLNYRRDGQPFMNLLMVAPLYDSRGTVRYHIGAQVDVSGLVRECAGLESLERLVERENMADGSAALPIRIHYRRQQLANGVEGLAAEAAENGKCDGGSGQDTDEFRDLASMFSIGELRTVREHGGSMHRIQQTELTDTSENMGANWNKPRLLIKDDASVNRRDSDPVLNASAAAAAVATSSLASGRIPSVYEHYLLVRPYPSLRVLFASPSLRVPGMLQSSLMSRIGGSSKIREAITQAFADGNGVTAKVRWTTGRAAGGPDRGRWIHCTPLLSSNGAVGVWMVVLVDDEQEQASRVPRDAPPINHYVRGVASGGSDASLDDLSLASFGDGGLGERDAAGRFSSSMGGREEEAGGAE